MSDQDVVDPGGRPSVAQKRRAQPGVPRVEGRESMSLNQVSELTRVRVTWTSMSTGIH